MTQNVLQRTEGRGDQPEHTHADAVHTHDHWHVSHHHGGLLGEFSHRSYWHTHTHNHSAMTHGHDYDVKDEEREHDKEAHIHDHTAPATSPGRKHRRSTCGDGPHIAPTRRSKWSACRLRATQRSTRRCAGSNAPPVARPSPRASR